MRKTAVVTDSNSGISPEEAKANGIDVISMPFRIGEREYLENVNLTQEEFFQKLKHGLDVSTSMPSPGTLMDTFDAKLKEYEDLVYIPMSSGLSGSCQAAKTLAEDYDGRVQVVDNKRISVTMRNSVLDALRLAKSGKNAAEIREILEQDAFNTSIYIMLDTLYYLKKGGRITPAAAALGTLLKLKPILQLHGEKLDAFAKARTIMQGKKIMLQAIREDAEKRLGGLSVENVRIDSAYTYDQDAAKEWKTEIESAFPGFEIYQQPLSLSIACHIGPGALAVTASGSQEAEGVDAGGRPG